MSPTLTASAASPWEPLQEPGYCLGVEPRPAFSARVRAHALQQGLASPTCTRVILLGDGGRQIVKILDICEHLWAYGRSYSRLKARADLPPLPTAMRKMAITIPARRPWCGGRSFPRSPRLGDHTPQIHTPARSVPTATPSNTWCLDIWGIQIRSAIVDQTDIPDKLCHPEFVLPFEQCHPRFPSRPAFNYPKYTALAPRLLSTVDASSRSKATRNIR